MERNTERERARKTERRQPRAQRRLEAATEVTRSNRAARHTSDGLAAGRPLAFWDKTRAWSAGMRRIQRQ